MLRSSGRRPNTVRARFAFVHVASLSTGKSDPEIGRALGNRDHTTIRNARAKAAELMETNGDFRGLIERVERRLNLLPEAA